MGLADADWLILWSVEWEDFPTVESDEPIIRKPERDSARWQEMCRLEQKEIIIRQFDIIEGEY